MADIKLNLKLLPNTTAVHIVSVDNECKELLFVIEATANAASKAASLYDIPITAVNLKSAKAEPQTANTQTSNTQTAEPHTANTHTVNTQTANTQTADSRCMTSFTFSFTQEEQASVIYAVQVGEYLYEPNKSILKGGAFKLLSEKYNLKKLAPSTHLYTSNQEVDDFPGKIFKVEESTPFNKKTIKQIASQYPKADITARNFPLDTNALKKLSGIKDGGDRHIFATTLGNGEKVIVIARNRK
jgi:hypothetical protein